MTETPRQAIHPTRQAAMAAQRDTKEFEVFYNEHFSLARAVIYRRLAGSAEVDDVTAEVFAVAWKHHQQGKELSLPWLYAVIRNVVGTEYRRSGRAARLLQTAPKAPPPNEFERAENGVDLHAALRRLRPVDSELIYLAFWDDLTTEEIAKVLGIRPGAVRVRLTRATAALRKVMATPTPPTRTKAVMVGG